MAGVILGTAAYMSPEQAKGLPVDRRSDIFSFGSVLYEMLAGRRAFAGELAAEILASVIQQEPDLSLLPPKLHPLLKDLLQRTFEKDPKDRWQAAGDMRLELTRISDDPEGASVPAARPSSGVPVGVLLASIAVTAVVVSMATRSLAPRDGALVSKFTHDLTPDQFFTNEGRPLLAISPDGRRVAYVREPADPFASEWASSSRSP